MINIFITKNLKILSVFVLILQILISSCVKQEIPTLTDTAFSYSIRSNGINYASQDTEYFEVKDFKLIVNLIESLDTSKINAINSENTSLNTEISSLLSSVNSSLSSLNTQKQSLANHINTITKKQYITYDIADKPDSIGSYFDKAYFLDLDLRNLLSDGVSLYAPDKDDADQDNLKESWEVSQDRVEVLDPSDLFDSIKAYSDEIQTAKDLISDYQNNVFANEDKLEAIQTLDSLVRNIKEHKALLLARAKKYSDDYELNHKNIQSSEFLKAYFLLELAEANNSIESDDKFKLLSFRGYFNDDKAFSIKRDDNNYFTRHPYLSHEEAVRIVDRYGTWATKFLTAPLPKQELQTRLILGYNKDQWDKIKEIDPATTTALVNSTMAMCQASLVYPTTYGDLIFGAGTFLRGAKLLSKINISDVKAFVAQAKVIKNEAISLTASIKKYFSKNLPKDCLKGFSTASFSVKAIDICPYKFLGKLNFPNGHTIGLPAYSQILKKEIKDGLKLSISEIRKAKGYPQNVVNDVISKIELAIATGVPRKARTGFPTFDSFTLFSAELGEKFVKHDKDFDKINEKLETIQFFISKGLISNTLENNPTQARIAIEKVMFNLKLTWHHHEDLKTMQLMPSVINLKVKHLGGSAIQKSLDKADISSVNYHRWRNGTI